MRILKMNRRRKSDEPEGASEGSTREIMTAPENIVQGQTRLVANLLGENQKLISIGRLTASIAHEINNPLEAVANLLYLIDKDPGLSPLTRSYMALAQQELGRVIQISKQTLSFSRETSAPVPIQMESLVEEVLILYARRIQEKRLHLFRQFRSTQSIAVFPGEMRQALSNLIVNAIEANPMDGSLWLRLSDRKNKGIRITIADNGSGIDPATRKRLGSPFLTTKGHQGTGLGLWVTLSILARHGARLQVRSSTHPDHHGSAFSILLPAEANPNNLGGHRSDHCDDKTIWPVAG